VILAVLFVVVGADRVIETLLAADPALVAATFGLALCWLIAWSLMLRTVLGSLDVDLSVTTSFLVYSGAVFANNVTPFGQGGRRAGGGGAYLSGLRVALRDGSRRDRQRRRAQRRPIHLDRVPRRRLLRDHRRDRRAP